MLISAVIDSMVWVNLDEISPPELESIKQRLTFIPRFKKIGAQEGEERIPVENFILTESRIGLPIDFGKSFVLDGVSGHGRFWEQFSNGESISQHITKLPDPYHANAGQGQAEFIEDLLPALKNKYAVLAEAATGSGKTVMALYAIAKIDKTACIIVPSIYLAEQWKSEAVDKLGMNPDDIGIVGNAKDKWRNKPIVICVINSACNHESRGYEFYENFGVVVWDEAHRLGASSFSESMHLFKSRHKLAMTATADRPDGMMGLVKSYFGEVAVKCEGNAIEAIVSPLVFTPNEATVKKLNKISIKPIRLKVLAKIFARNDGIADVAATCYRRDRCVLIIAEHIAHLQTLHNLLRTKFRVPVSSMGMFIGKGHAITIGDEEVKITSDYLKNIKENDEIRIILATYTMMKEGVDIKRLDVGIDATPRSQAIQVVGRIRRPMTGKKKPVWYTIIDKGVHDHERQAEKRIDELARTNCIILEPRELNI